MKMYKVKVLGYTGVSNYTILATHIKIEDNFIKFYVRSETNISGEELCSLWPIDKTIIYDITDNELNN